MTEAPRRSPGDVVATLLRQHEQIKEAFLQVRQHDGDERRRRFFTLRQLLAMHEAIEEEVVHPRARDLSSGDAIVSARLEEEVEAKSALTEIEQFDVDSVEFLSRFRKLEKDVIAHAEAEEKAEFSRLEADLGYEDLQHLSAAFSAAMLTDSTRLTGSFTAMLDQALEAIEAARTAP